MRRRDFMKVIAASSAAWPHLVHAQRAVVMRRIGVLHAQAEDAAEVRRKLERTVRDRCAAATLAQSARMQFCGLSTQRADLVGGSSPVQDDEAK
ncbi:MAG: hypothetical protein WBG18_07765, partial [Xanthobacteraceae bacterium]